MNALSWVVLGCTLSNAVNNGQVEDTDHQRQDMVQMLDSFPKLFMYQAVDACDEGVGAVLLQVDDEDFDKTVVYFSKKLNSHQKEVNPFKVYVASEECVVVYSYHSPLSVSCQVCEC